MRSLFASGTVAFALTLSASAGAANLPEKFNGMWLATDTANNRCVVADVKAEKDGVPVDRVMSVGPGEVAFYETRCTFTSVKPIKNANPNDKNQVNAEVTLACKGEGMLWNAREIWHVQTIDGNKVAVITALGQSNYRDDKGRKQNTPSTVTTSIYYECK